MNLGCCFGIEEFAELDDDGAIEAVAPEAVLNTEPLPLPLPLLPPLWDCW